VRSRPENLLVSFSPKVMIAEITPRWSGVIFPPMPILLVMCLQSTME
jgi:hypothetical protein